jgi:microcystin-dependent protein
MRLKKVVLGLVLICVASLLLYPGMINQASAEPENNLSAAEAGIPIGTVITFAGAIAPEGYLICDGKPYSRLNYQNLYMVIGTMYGVGDGGSTFKVPDLRGEFLRGVDSGRGIDTGRALGSSQADELKSHTHRIIGSAGGENTDAYNPSTGVCSANSYYGIFGGGIENTGGSETRPRNVAINYCIKY